MGSPGVPTATYGKPRAAKGKAAVKEVSPAQSPTWSSAPAWWYLGVGCAATFGDYLGLFGRSGMIYPLLVLSCFAATVFAIRTYRPSVRWPFVCFAAAVGLFFVGGATREMWNTLGDISARRSLVPDVITIPGYALLAVGMFGLSRARRGGRHDLDGMLDAALVALGALACAWAFLITPALANTGAPIGVRTVLTIYPAASIFLVAAWLQILSMGGARRSISHRLLLAALSFLLLGDVIYTLVDARIATIPLHIIDVPYLLANVLFGVVHLHPSMRELCEPVPRAQQHGRIDSRLAIVATALGLPTVVVLLRPSLSGADRAVLAIIVLTLTATAIWRVFRALRAHATSETQLVYQATHDALTGLPNRAYLKDYLDQEIARHSNTDRSFALLFLDLDRFKLVNDALGHTVGDQLLRAVAHRLGRVVPASAKIARIGGDEFVIVIGDVSGADQAVRYGEEIRASFSLPFAVAESEIYASVSVGVALAGPSASRDAESLIRDADTAMYQAKVAGRDDVALYDAEARERTTRRLALERQLRGVLDRDELQIHYQPIVDGSTRKVIGFEALLRWAHPELGNVPPLDFVPVAEETGMIVEIGAWVLKTAAEQLAYWRAHTSGAQDLYVAVNLSARQLHEPGFVELVLNTARDAGLPNDAMRLELTESLLIEQRSVVASLDQLRAAGFSLSIDDFGTGYSSLAYLRRFHVDEVKIDKAFIDDLARSDGADSSLVEAIIAVAHAIGIHATAEGVELPVQADRLRELGVDSMQGYLYSRPATAADIPSVIARINLLTRSEGPRVFLPEPA